MTSAENTAVPAVISDYRIVKLLGEGNHGKFYLAKPPARLGLATEHVALKVFSAQISEDAFRRGVRELRAFAAVSSTRIVRIYDAVLEGTFMYAMEYFPLGSLAAPARALSRAEILRALQDAASAVHELHEAGMAHSDIKPANVMLDENGGKLSDLGLARVLASENQLTGMAPATSVEYLDPAMLLGALPSRATDVWALGATVNRALSGDGLYGELPVNQPMLAFRAVHSGRAVVSPRLTAKEAALVNDCLAPAATRLPTAAAVADRLAELRRG